MKSIRHIHRLVLAAIILICTFDASGATTVAVAAADFTKDKDGLAAFVFEVLQTELSARPDIELVDRKSSAKCWPNRASEPAD